MGNVRKPLKRGILTVFILFITLLCVVLFLMQVVSYRDTLYRSIGDHIRNVLSLAASYIDVDDLAKCMATGEMSEKYHQLQRDLDQIKENVDLHYLYVIVPLNTEPSDNVLNVIWAVSEEERKEMPEDLVTLNQLSGNAYSPAVAEQYLKAYQSGTLTFFEERSEFGHDYTGLLPLYDSQQNLVAALCVDVDIQTIRRDLIGHTRDMLLAVIFLGTLFAMSFLIWAEVNVVGPIKKLEGAVARFASRSHQVEDLDELVLAVPEIHTGNEVESLSLAFQKMSTDMKEYIIQAAVAQRELARMNVVAHRDGLTHVGNKSAFDQYVQKMDEALVQENQEFGILAMDLNGLMRINNSFGHEKGDLYLKNSCSIICGVFKHSTVFRVGGDEFVVVLTGRDYLEREELVRLLREEISRTREGVALKPWEKLSLAIGSALFDQAIDTSVKDVLERAERQMSVEKEKISFFPE